MPKRKSIKIVGIIAVIFLVMIFALRQILMYTQEQSEFQNKSYDTLQDFQTIQEVAKYLDCEYIQEEKSKNEKYDKDIYLTFKYDLYTDGASNQEYFYRASILFAQVTGYTNIRLIDDSKNLVIAIIGDSANKVILKLYINGNDNYYGEKDTIKALESYKDTNISRLEIQSSIINDLITNEWEAKQVDLGTQESTLDNYAIYFDEGYDVKKVGTKVFNIVFRQKYDKEVVNGIKVGTDLKEVVNKLGEPSFGGVDRYLLGYKGEKMYIFFTEKTISVYPVQSASNEQQLLTLIEKFRQDLNLKSFISSITDLWPDYDKYEYDENYVNLTYTLRGIQFKFNVDRDSGVVFYSNYGGSYITDLRKNKNNLPKYTYFTDENLVYENEYSNKSSIHNYAQWKSDYTYKKECLKDYMGIEEEVSGKFFVKEDESGKASILSLDDDNPPSEINEKVYSYIWLDDYNLAYSIQNKGMYLYNAQTMETKIILEGQDNFQIKSYENNRIYYDDKNMIYLLDGSLPSNYDSIIWLNDDTLAYSKKNQGIYKYNLTTQETETILEGNETFNLVKYENSRIYYDDKNIIYILN